MFLSRFSSVVRSLGVVSALLLAAGCASDRPPAQFVEGVTWVAEKHQARDAKTQRVEGYASLRMDAALIDRLDAVLKQDDLQQAKKDAVGVLDEGHALAMQSTGNELLRLDDAGWRELAVRYYHADIAPDQQMRRLLTSEFQRQAGLHLYFLKQQIQAAGTVDALREVLLPVRKATEQSAKHAGRLGRSAPLAVFAVPAVLAREAIHASEATCQGDEPFAAAVHYEPDARSTSALDAAHWDLLTRNAPVFVQEVAKDARYAPTVDELGQVTAADDGTIAIDVTRPAVYGYARKVLLNGRPHVQLTYAIWYPEHPKLRSGVDPEAGRIDGATIRITLDSENRPATIETLNNCGCHHRLYPADGVEQAARQEFGSPLKGKAFALERDVESKYDLIIPKVIDPAAGSRPIVRCRAGTHAVVDTAYGNADHVDEPVAARRGYVLKPYDELERLTTPGGRTVSMFLPNGLVRGAERLEGTLFRPLGMLNAGQPRQRGTQLIQWDQYDFDDPRLLEKTLRLPTGF